MHIVADYSSLATKVTYYEIPICSVGVMGTVISELTVDAEVEVEAESDPDLSVSFTDVLSPQSIVIDQASEWTLPAI